MLQADISEVIYGYALNYRSHQAPPYLIKDIQKWLTVALHQRGCLRADNCESSESLKGLVAVFDIETQSNRIVLFSCRILFP